MALCLLGWSLLLPQTAACKEAGKREAPSWQGEYIGENAILAIDDSKDGRTITYVLTGRANPKISVNGAIDLKEEDGREGGREGFDFVLSQDASEVVVTTLKKGANGEGDEVKWAGSYVRIKSFAVKDGLLVFADTGAPLPDDMGKLSPVKNSDLTYAIIPSVDRDDRNLPLRPGLYIVTRDGQVNYMETPEGSEYLGDLLTSIALSPDKEILVVGLFVFSIDGEWEFFSLADMKPLKHYRLNAYWQPAFESASLVWAGKRTVVAEQMGDAGNRACEYDPCGIVSVVVFDLDTGKVTVPIKGTDLCDYHVESVQDGRITATKLCLPTGAAWKNYPENEPTETVTAPLP
jgi:hypothetical protein